MLASYGYVHSHGSNANNKAIPNMNNPVMHGFPPNEVPLTV